MNDTVKYALSGLLFTLIIGGSISLYFALKAEEPAPITGTPQSVIDDRLAAAENVQAVPINELVAAVNGLPTPQTQGATTTQEQEPEIAPGPNYTLEFPDGWIPEFNELKTNPCDPDSDEEWITTTYKKGTQQITIYENALPNDCADNGVADVYLDFEYTSDLSGVVVPTGEGQISFCDLSTPGCPKGDGRVSVYIGNEDPEQPNTYIKNELNNNSYFFSILDTSVQSDLQAQVESLVEIVRDITFTR